MIIINTLFFLIISYISIISLSGFGSILNRRFKSSFLENIFFGFFLFAFLITLIHFFLKINFFVSAIVLLVGFYLGIKNLDIINQIINKKNLISIIIFLFLIPIYLSQKYHEDFGYYHLPYLINMFNEKIIFGLASTNIAFVHNSIWLNIMSIFFLKNNYDFVTLPTFLIYSIFIIFSVNKIFNEQKYKISNFFLIVSVSYFILKFTRISEFGNDIPAVIFSILSIFYYLRFQEESKLNNKYHYFFCNLSFGLFAILIKFSCIPILLLTFFLLLKNWKNLKKEIFSFNFIFIYFLSLLFFIQQFFLTGCFIFPSKITCLDVSWFNKDFIDLRVNLELINKGYYGTDLILSKKDYLNNFNWLTHWFNRSYPEIFEHLITMLIPVILIIFLFKKEKNNENFNFIKNNFFLFFILFSFVFWLKFSPVYRFAIPYFLSLIFLINYKFYSIKKFSKKIFTIILILMISFNFSKNILRISNKNMIHFGIDKINNKFTKSDFKSNNYLSINKPNIKENKSNGWQGRLCWDIPFLCSYNAVQVNKKYGYLFINKLNN